MFVNGISNVKIITLVSLLFLFYYKYHEDHLLLCQVCTILEDDEGFKNVAISSPNTLTRLVDVDVESAAEGYNFPRRSRTQDNL
jgi:hypothetical protein